MDNDFSFVGDRSLQRVVRDLLRSRSYIYRRNGSICNRWHLITFWLGIPGYSNVG